MCFLSFFTINQIIHTVKWGEKGQWGELRQFCTNSIFFFRFNAICFNIWSLVGTAGIFYKNTNKHMCLTDVPNNTHKVLSKKNHKSTLDFTVFIVHKNILTRVISICNLNKASSNTFSRSNGFFFLVRTNPRMYKPLPDTKYYQNYPKNNCLKPYGSTKWGRQRTFMESCMPPSIEPVCYQNFATSFIKTEIV